MLSMYAYHAIANKRARSNYSAHLSSQHTCARRARARARMA